MKEKLNMPGTLEVQTPFHLCKQLLEAAEACEVREYCSMPTAFIVLFQWPKKPT
jgi:hypothetical protein